MTVWVAPLCSLRFQPFTRLSGGAALDDVQQATGGDINDRCRPQLHTPPPEPGEQGLVQAERCGRADPFWVLDEGCAVGDHGVVDRVPIASQLDSLVHGPPVSPDLLPSLSPTTGPVGDRHPRRRDPPLLPGPRQHCTRRRRTRPSLLTPHQSSWPTEAWQIDRGDGVGVFLPTRLTAPDAARARRAGRDMDFQRVVWAVDDTEDGDIGQADEQLAHASRV